MHLKRLFDLVVVTLAATIWLPVLLLAAGLVLVGSGRPVLYRSQRLVAPGQPMRVAKFRTMVKNADLLANRDTVPVTTTRFLNIAADSPLYTRAGRFLERCGVAELPQLLPVLRGRMSLVGNRPLPSNVMAALLAEHPDAGDRLLSPAGLTGVTRLIGLEALTDAERLRVEAAYCRAVVHGYRLRLDLVILLHTVLITAGLRATMDQHRVLALIEGHSVRRVPALGTAQPAPVSSGVVSA